MNLLSTIIERLNQRVEAGNIFDQIYGLCELSADGNDKAWIHYIGNGQAVPVTNFDAKQGTIFWAKRGKISVSKNESLKLAGCKALYETKFILSAYAVVRKDHLPCDSADAQDWIASRVLRLVSGTDPQFKTAIGVVAYEVVPNGYVNEIKSLTANYEWACVSIDVDVNVLTSSEDGCYDTCATGDIPLPDFEPCTPCLTEVAVDGVTITGNGTTEDPLVAIGGGGGGGSLRVQDEGTTVTNAATTLNFTGNVTASLASAGNVTVNVPAETPQVNADWNASSGVAEILNKPTIPNAQVNSDWNASSGVAEILNKPSIPAAQIQSDWNQANNAALDFIKNKPTIPSTSGFVPYTGATTNVDLGTHTLSAKDLVISHPSGSGVAASITKGGAGEALTVVKSSGSGNAASITGGVTLIDELHLTTDLADAYIASAATWNAKQDALSAGTGISLASNTVTNTAPDQTVVINAGTGIGVSGTYPNFTIANTVNGFVRNEYTASGAATLDIPIPSGYSKHVITVQNAVGGTANSQLWARMGIGAPSVIQSGATDYTWARGGATGNAAFGSSSAGDSVINLNGATMPTGASGRSINMQLVLNNASGTTFNKSVQGTFTGQTNAGQIITQTVGGVLLKLDAITSLRLLCSTGNISATVVIESYL
jgi:hypothetical protein